LCLLKQDNSALLTNYRPITILNKFSKISDIIILVYDQLSSYFKFNHPFQHDFIKLKSTPADLITYLNSVTFSVSSQEQIDSIHFDFSQALDKVRHSLLLHKCNYFGLSERYITWLKSYFLYTFSFVRTLGKFSSPFPALLVVQQGSTFEAPLFSILINYLCIKFHFCDFLLFSDDLYIFSCHKVY
jgi:hypothetical protein